MKAAKDSPRCLSPQTGTCRLLEELKLPRKVRTSGVELQGWLHSHQGTRAPAWESYLLSVEAEILQGTIEGA